MRKFPIGGIPAFGRLVRNRHAGVKLKPPIGSRQSAIPALWLAGLLALAGCGWNEDPETLVVYSCGPRALAEEIAVAFERQTGNRVRLFAATTGEVMAKLQAEEFHPHADVVILASMTAAEALQRAGRLAPLPEMDGLPFRPDWTGPEHTYTGTSACALGIALRKEHHDPDLEWHDVWNGRLAGPIIMPSPSQSGTSGEFVTAFHIAERDDFWDGLKAAKRRGLQTSGPNSQALTSLTLGSHTAVVAAADYLVFNQIAQGNPLVMHFPPSGSPVVPRPIAIMKNARRGGIAAEFVRFVFAPAAQELIAARHLIPADPDIPVSAMRREAGEVNPVMIDPTAAVMEHRTALRRFRHEVERIGP